MCWVVGVVVALLLLAWIVPLALSGGSCSKSDAAVAQVTAHDATRPESKTFLTFPEWYIVYSAEEYAHFIAHSRPEHFPYIRAIGQYWCSYRVVSQHVAAAKYQPEHGEQFLLFVIGTSFSLEYEIRFVYENTVGRITNLFIGSDTTPEDTFGQKVEQEYADSLYETPWYSFPYFQKLGGLWRSTPLFGPHLVRKWERKLSLSIGYLIKGSYAKLIGFGAGAAYAPDDLMLTLVASHVPAVLPDARIKVLKTNADGTEVLQVPRYGSFTTIVESLTHSGTIFTRIAGNDSILVSVIAPSSWEYVSTSAPFLFSMPLAIDGSLTRFAFTVSVPSLAETLVALEHSGATIEHVYDY